MIIEQQPSNFTQFPQVVSSMAKSRRRSVSPAEPAYRLAKVLVEQEKWEDAIAAYRQALTLAPTWVEVQRELGDLLLKLERWEEAVNVYETAITFQSDVAQVHHNLGDVLLKLERYEDAVSAYQKAIALNPNFSWSYNNLGDALRELQRWDEAAQAYQNAIKLKGDFALSHHNLGDVLVKKEEWEEAIAAYQKAIELNPNFVWSYYNLGDVLVKKEEWESAIVAYRSAVKLDLNLPQVHEKLGDALRNQSQKYSQEISQVYHRAIEDNPTDLQLYYKALEANPKDAEISLKLADIFRNQGKTEQAITFYKSTLQIEPNNFDIQAVAWQNLGNIFKQLGRLQEAAKAYHQVVELKPEWTLSHFNLIQVLQQLGRLQEAEKAGNRAVEIEPRLANFYRNSGVIKGDILAVDTNHQLGKRPKVAVCSWELAHNSAGRAYTLAQLYQEIADVEMIGSIFPNYGRELWEPIRKTSIPCHSFIVEDESQFAEQAMNLVLSHPYDVVHLSKPRMPNILFGLLYKLVWNARVIVDIDDEELAFVQAETSIELEDFLKSQGQLPKLKNLTGQEWTQIAVRLVKEFDAVTVSNPALQKRYGGEIIRHARDEKLFEPSSERRYQSRERLGISQEQKVVLFFGTPREHKSLVATAEALANLGWQDVVFVIVGDFPEPSLKAKLQAIQGVNYLFLGNQPFDEIPDVVAVGDVCVLLQDEESPVSRFQIPAKLSDALGMGLTVLLSESVAVTDVIESGAVLRACKSNLGAVLSRVLSDEADTQRLGSKARELFLAEFSYAKNEPRLGLVLGSVMVQSTSKGQLSDRLNLLFGGLPSVGLVLSRWREQKVENLAVPATSEVLKVNQSDVDQADHNLREMPKKENQWQQYETGNVNLFLKKINKSYLKKLVIENEKYVESYSRILKKAANRCLKVMVGTLYSGESELDLCTASVNRQTYRNIKHIVIKNLPNVEAHNTLYETFLNSEFDILIKLDADMVLIDDNFFDKVVNLVLFSKGLAIIQIAILDFYTGRAIQGLNVYTKLFKWNCQKTDKVFTDRSKVKFENRMLVWNKFQRSVIHSPNPSNFQAFHFGIHRAIKVIEANQRGDINSAVEQYVYLEKTHEHYLLRKTNNLLMASIGAQIGLSGIFTHEAIDYTNNLLKIYYQKLIKEESDLHGFLMELRQKFATELNLELVRGIAKQHLQEKCIKRVSFLLPHLQTFGGVFRFLELARELGRNGIEAVISVLDEGMSDQDIEQVKQSFDNIKISKLSQSILEDWDVVVCGDFSSGLFLTLPYFKTRLTCAYLLNGWQHRYINIEQINLAKPELVVANSSYCAKHYQDLAPVIIPGGINLITFQLNNYDVQKKLSIVKIFVPVGRRKPRKRFDDALVACRDLSNKYQIELHTVDTHELPNFSAGNLSHIHHQNLTREKIANLLNQMDMAILPEEDAGWNNYAAEALAVGCPVICTEAGTIDFAIDNETVLLVTPRNPIEISNAASLLIESYELRLKLSTNGRKHIKQFSWYYVAKNLLNLFYESMKASESRPNYLPIIRRNIDNLFTKSK